MKLNGRWGWSWPSCLRNLVTAGNLPSIAISSNEMIEDHVPALFTPISSHDLRSTDANDLVPSVVSTAGSAACCAWEEFIYGTISNAHTRRSYGYAARRFFNWADDQGLELARIAPKDVRAYLDKHLCHHKTNEPLTLASKKIHYVYLQKKENPEHH